MAENNTSANPLLEAKPPATDYMNYLILIENNLTEENLPVLHQVLQDTELTAGIGWDLIHLLLPFLPASEDCLGDIAARGNPRECILKVTEALRLLEFEDHEEEDSEDEDAQPGADESKKPDTAETRGSSSAQSSPSALPLTVLKFQTLLSLLSTLHRRIKTKRPSSFLATSLQAVLSAYNNAKHHQDELTLSAVKFVKTISGTKRPHLPPRTSTGSLLRKPGGVSEPDPEAEKEPKETGEDALVERLLQSFVTHLLEDYILSLSSADDVPGLAWSSRLMEKFEPRRVVPKKKTYAERFAKEEGLKSRSGILGQIVALAQDLNLSTQDLFQTITDPESEKQGVPGAEDEPPAQADDVPLSKTGSLFLYTARNVKQKLYDSANSSDDTVIHIFPDHATIVNNFVGTLGPQTVGLEPEALLDAVLSLGLIALENNNIGEPSDDDQFVKYLQTTSLISANTPSPSLRYHAHYLTSTILRSHPHDLVRLTFIRDTLEHCPFENLKASAVGWLKGETLEANISHHHHHHDHQEEDDNDTPSHESSIFATPVALSTVSPYLFPDLTSSWISPVEISESWMQFRTELGFYLSALNFYYLLLTAKQFHENLDIAGLHTQSQVEDRYLKPLKEAIGRFREALEDGGELAIAEGEEVGGAKSDLAILEDVIGRVEGGVKGL